MPYLFSLVAPIILARRWIMLKSYAEYTLRTTRVDSLPCRSLVLKAEKCYLPAGITNERHLADLKASGIGPDEVVFVNDGYLDAVLADPDKKVIKDVAEALKQGHSLRLFHPMPRTLEELRLKACDHSKLNVLFIEELKKQLNWSDRQIWERLVLNNDISGGSSFDDQSKIAQYESLGDEGAAYYPPFEVSEVSVTKLTEAAQKVELAFFKRYGFWAPARIKMDGKASGDGQWSLRDTTIGMVVDEIERQQDPQRPRWKRVATVIGRNLPRISGYFADRVVSPEKVLVVPCIAEAMVDLSVNSLILNKETDGVAPGVYVIGITRQMARITSEKGSEWCGNMQVLPGMVLRPAEPERDVPALIATEGFIHNLKSKIETYLDAMVEKRPMSGLNSTDVGFFYNPAKKQWEVIVHEINPRPTNGTHLCELLWQVAEQLKERNIVTPPDLTGALLILKINKQDGMTYEQQLEALGEDYLPNDYSRLTGAKPVVPDAALTEGQMVYGFVATDTQELCRLIERVWLKLKCKGYCDAVLLLNE